MSLGYSTDSYQSKYLIENDQSLGTSDGDHENHPSISAVTDVPKLDHPDDIQDDYHTRSTFSENTSIDYNSTSDINYLINQSNNGIIDLDSLMISAVHGERHQGVKPSESAK